jgi:acrylyl-CoA reductase (NADPH)
MKRRRSSLASTQTGWWITDDASGSLGATLRDDILEEELGDGAVTVEIHHSALNYKDALALTGSTGVVRTTPLIPGIDFAGQVVDSSDPAFTAGEHVVLTGWGYGETRHGGLATRAKVEAQHLVRLPASLSTFEAAALGTAAFTAALAIDALEKSGTTPDRAPLPIAVTGAGGAVGSWAIVLLAHRGYRVVAVTGRSELEPYLRSLGAEGIMPRSEILQAAQRPLRAETFSGVVDQAGGPLLASLLSMVASNGVAVACGLAGGVELSTTVMPFILRGISLVGINSVTQPPEVRERVWSEFAKSASSFPFTEIASSIRLTEALATAPSVLAGETRGRVVVEVGP